MGVGSRTCVKENIIHPFALLPTLLSILWEWCSWKIPACDPMNQWMEIDGVWLLDKRSNHVEIRLNWKGRMQMWGASLARKSASYPDDKRPAWVLVCRKEKV